MKTFNTYITLLLETHDCVIIPGFGGFLLNNTAAGFSDNGNEVHPATRRASFNRSLNVNDGLLAHFISNSEGITYADSLLFIRSGVETIKSRLNEGFTVKIDQVGSLLQTSDDRIVFSPDLQVNYLKTSFGLPALALTPIEKQLSKIQKINEYQVKPGTLRKIRPAGAIISIAASLIIALSVFLKNNDIDPEKIAYAVYHQNADVVSLPALETPVQQNLAVPDVQKEISKNPAIEKNNQSGQIVPGLQAESVPSHKFYVVGGSFKKEANADIFVRKLKKKGFEAQVLNTETGFYRVTYEMAIDSIHAGEALHKIKISENQDAWLLKW